MHVTINKKIFIALFFCLAAVSCKKKQEVFCTMEFRTVSITVNRGLLDDFYTIRESTGDTIRIDRGNIPGNNEYPVLDDRFQTIIRDRTESFRFLGFINNVETVNEIFVIKADQCHIDYVSGNLVVN